MRGPFISNNRLAHSNESEVKQMNRWSLHDSAMQRRGELLAEAARARMVSQSRRSRGKRTSGRTRVARVLLALGYFFLDAGHSLDADRWRSV